MELMYLILSMRAMYNWLDDMNFACVCYGDKYSVEYVQKLYNMVKRNTTIPINFIVFTDHVKMHKMVEGDIDIRKFPETDLQRLVE